MWPNKDKPGYPENKGYHFIYAGNNDPDPWFWNGEYWGYGNGPIHTPKEMLDRGYKYKSRCYNEQDLIEACKKQRLATAQDMVDILDEATDRMTAKLEAITSISETFKMALERLQDGTDEQE